MSLKKIIYYLLYLLVKQITINSNKLHNKFLNKIYTFNTNEKISFKNYTKYNIIGKSNSNFLIHYNDYEFNNPYYILFENILVVGKINRTPVYLTNKYEPLLLTTNNSYYCLLNSGSIFEIFKSLFKRKKKLRNIISITGTMTKNPYHWYTEYLPRLEIIYNKLIEEDYYLLLDTDLNSFQKESLKMLSIPENKIINWDGNTTLINNCIIPSLRHEVLIEDKLNIHSRNSYKWIRNKILEYIDDKSTQKYNIIISRNDSNSRRLINEIELQSNLIKYNFIILNLSELSQKEIINYFNKAKIIIGVHGAAFTYTLFSKNAKIVEIFPNNYQEKGNKKSTHNCQNSYFQISAYLNNYHWVYITESVSDENFDVKLDIDKFCKYMNLNIL